MNMTGGVRRRLRHAVEQHSWTSHSDSLPASIEQTRGTRLYQQKTQGYNRPALNIEKLDHTQSRQIEGCEENVG
jgi:hypothetical protein